MKLKAFLVLFFASAIGVYAQCGCPGGIPISIPPTTVGGTTDVGAMNNNVLRALAFFRYGAGDQNYVGDATTEEGAVRKSSSSYSGLLLGYGIIDNLTLEAELGYFLNKHREEKGITKTVKFNTSGLADVVLSAKYSLYKSADEDFEYTAGIGARIPVSRKNDTINGMELPPYMLASTGAYAMVLHSFLHKDFYKLGFHFFLMNRFEMSGENQNSYKYGNALFSSIFLTKMILPDITAMFEVRNEYKAKDAYKSIETGKTEDNENSGSVVFYVSPQLNYNWGQLNVSASFDIPVYQYYNGEQMGNSYTFGINISYITNLGGSTVPVESESEE